MVKAQWLQYVPPTSRSKTLHHVQRTPTLTLHAFFPSLRYTPRHVRPNVISFCPNKLLASRKRLLIQQHIAPDSYVGTWSDTEGAAAVKSSVALKQVTLEPYIH
jgi:hypothetical protein